MSDQKYRLVTRADFDGVVSGGLLVEKGLIGDIMFADPGDVQAGRVAIGENDITTSLPYVEAAHLCFNRHVSEQERVGDKDNLIIDPTAPSVARVVFSYYGEKEGFPEISEELLDVVDHAQSAQYSIEDILAPEKWTLLYFLLDPRTGMSRFEDEFAIPHDQLMKDMMTYVRHHPIEEILQLPDVEERLLFYQFRSEKAEHQINRCTTQDGTVAVCDFRGEDILEVGNRFMIYGLFPECSVSVQVSRSSTPGLTNISAGKSITDRTLQTSLGSLMLEYGGGGHDAAGSCQVEDARVDEVVTEIKARLNAAG